MRWLLTTSAAFIALVLTGGVWLGVVEGMTDQPGLEVAILGGVFALLFMWLLVQRLRSLLAHPDRRLRELALLAFNMTLIIFAFAWVHHRIGLMDLSGPGPRPTDEFADALYFSVVTITTLGYGDFIPIGVGRTIAAIQGLLGYFILGILVSTGYQLISPHSRPGEDEDRGAEAEAESGEDGQGENDDGEQTGRDERARRQA